MDYQHVMEKILSELSFVSKPIFCCLCAVEKLLVIFEGNKLIPEKEIPEKMSSKFILFIFISSDYPSVT